MSFSVTKNQSMARNLERLLISQSLKAIQELESFISNPEESVHQARVRLKRIRTLLRLVKKSLGKSSYQQLNRAYRDLGFALSVQRDNQVKQKLLCQLGFAEEADRLIEYTTTGEDRQTVLVVLEGMRDLEAQLLELKIKPKGFKLIRNAVVKIYRDGKKAMLVARKTDDDVDFHEWRKSTKHLYHLVAMLQPLNPSKLTPLREDLDCLSQLLGEDHDLSLLKADSRIIQYEGLEQRIHSMQQDLRKKEQIAGEALYQESASEFIKQMERYWKA